MPDRPVLRVALDIKLAHAFDYLPPADAGAAAIEPGMRVLVPFGRGRRVGIVLERDAAPAIADERLKSILAVIDHAPVLDRSALALLGWAAEYYHHPIGEVLATALPKALRRGAPAQDREEHWSATEEGRTALTSDLLPRAPKQRGLLQLLAAQGPLSSAALRAQLGEFREPARALLARGWIGMAEMPTTPAGAASAAPAPPQQIPELRAEQSSAVDAIVRGLGGFAAYVLQGVTGSGKTEVYLRVVARVLEQGRRALVLVPEIGLTPQLVGRFRERFAEPIAVLHSSLTDHERLLAWRQAFSGHARIVIGTRSAVFAPVADLGIIVVDEEHDPSFKQHESGFRYSARDLAVVRAQRASVPIVLGSATPALETLHNAAAGRYHALALRERARGAAQPQLALIDLRAHAVRSGMSTPAARALERHLQDGAQVLVFLNRRGYAPTLICTACGWIAPCRECDARLTVHLGAQRLRCHHCGADAPLPARCPQCGFAVKPVGQGTERIEEALATLFPGVGLARLDRDVVRRRGDVERIVQSMASGAARILIGTQMVTKGHDFPELSLVVVLNADQGLFGADFRAPERLAQTIMQVAGRAGRGERAGEVLIQTEFPDHPLLQSLLRQGYDGFARAALAERAQTGWPPFSRLAAVRDSARTPEAALAFLSDARALLPATRGVRVLGPVPAAMAKRAGRHHAQLLLESTERAPLHRLLTDWLPRIALLKSSRRVRWALDVDPYEI